MQPIIIEDRITIAAGSVNDNVIVSNSSLRRYLRAPFLAVGDFLALRTADGLRVSLDYGSKNVVDNSDLRTAATPAIEVPFDRINDQWYPNQGDQLVLRAANPTGAPIDLIYRITLTPLDDLSELRPDKRVTQRQETILAGAIDVQLLDGSRYEQPPVDSLLDVFMTGSAAGLTRKLDVEQDSIAPPSAIPPSNRIPRDPLDQSISDVEVPQDKLILLAVSNPTGGNLVAFWRSELTELARS
jgi:hypothetical protein